MPRRLMKTVMFPYWRLTRGMTVGVQAVIIRGGSEVLLIRHGYRPGWHFPGGGVEWRETFPEALAREVEEETGVIIKEPRLHGLFANFRTAPCDHIALYIVENWEQPRIPEPGFEIREQRFVPTSELPEDTVHAVRRRLGEIFRGAPINEHW